MDSQIGNPLSKAKRHRNWLATNPWLQHNLVRNPFGELTRDEKIEAVVLDEIWLESCTRWLGQKRALIELVGRKGRGKTTRLLALSQRLQGAHYVYISEDRHVPGLPEAHPLIIDEAQRLPRNLLKRILRSETALVLSTHWPLLSEVHRPSRMVRRQRIGSSNNESLIAKAISKRIELARYRPGQIPCVSQSEVKRLHKRYGTNMRMIEEALYQEWQQRIGESLGSHHGGFQR
ncbi:MAG: hypothetical protein AAF664_25330 [Planctomycetota bacterium]